MDREEAVRATARRHGLSEGAVDALWDALVRGRGQAQFSHPELGGMGQWSGGMVQIGDMFNTGLKAKVAAACADLAARLEGVRDDTAFSEPSRPPGQGRAASDPASGAQRPRTSVPRTGVSTPSADLGRVTGREAASWWPDRYGAPASAGSQNGLHYAYFPDRRRLLVHRDGRVTVYDTGHHRLIGVSQAQSHHQSLVFTSQDGTVGLGDFVSMEE